VVRELTDHSLQERRKRIRSSVSTVELRGGCQEKATLFSCAHDRGGRGMLAATLMLSLLRRKVRDYVFSFQKNPVGQP
jgi:hypothetical protein